MFSLVSANVVKEILKGAKSFNILVDSRSLFSVRKSVLFKGRLLVSVLVVEFVETS